MSGFDDLILEAMPFLASEHIQGTSGADWEWIYDLTDNSAAAVDMTSGFTGICKIRTAQSGGSDVATPTVTFPAAGRIKCAVPNATTESIAAGVYYHELEVTRTSDGKKIKVVGAGRGVFEVLDEVM